MWDFDGRLKELAGQQLLRQRRVVEDVQGTQLTVDGKTYLSFCGNDYLGLSKDPTVVKAARQGALQYGVGATASPLVCGHLAANEYLEKRLASFVELPRALYFQAGYSANIGIVSALVERGDAIFSDTLNHASLIDGARLSRADIHRYPHADVEALANLLAESSAKRKLVITDGVFSMDGDLAPLAQIVAVCERYDAMLLVDDAHGFGVLGHQGRGILSHFQIRSPRVLYLATLSKAAGGAGAFVAGQAKAIEWIMQKARTYIFSTAPAPMISTAMMESLRAIETQDWRRKQLSRRVFQLHNGLADLKWKVRPMPSAIQPIILGDNATALGVMNALRELGVWVPAIRPPTVPEGTARLRVSVSAAHTEADIAKLVDALLQVSQAFSAPTYG